MDMDMRMGIESMGNSIIVDRSCSRTGCDGLMGEGKRERVRVREVEEHTGIENEGNEEKVNEEEEEGHAAVIFQGSTYLFFFSCFCLVFGGSCLSCMQQVLTSYVRVIRLERKKRERLKIEDWYRNICGGCFFGLSD